MQGLWDIKEFGFYCEWNEDPQKVELSDMISFTRMTAGLRTDYRQGKGEHTETS